jgi:hypothetical protein
MDRNNDYLSPGCGQDGGKDEGFQLKGVDRAAMKKLYGPDVGGPATGDEARGGAARKRVGVRPTTRASWPAE